MPNEMFSFVQCKRHIRTASKFVLSYMTCRECEVMKGKTKEIILLVIDKREDNFVLPRVGRSVLHRLVNGVTS